MVFFFSVSDFARNTKGGIGTVLKDDLAARGIGKALVLRNNAIDGSEILPVVGIVGPKDPRKGQLK